MSARIQVFDYKSTYEFLTVPGIDKYNMPLYDTQSFSTVTIEPFPMFQGFSGVVQGNGYNTTFFTEKQKFHDYWPEYLQDSPQAKTGDGGTDYTINLPFYPAVPGIVDIAGIMSTGSSTDPIYGTTVNETLPPTSIFPSVYFQAVDSNGKNVIVSDSGQFFSGNTSGDHLGLLINATNLPNSYSQIAEPGLTSNVVNYTDGVAYVTFPTAIPSGNPISAKCYYFQQGLPRSILFYNNTLTIRPPPDKAYKMQLDAYLTPAAYLATTDIVKFGYMTEYIARGSARKVLSDTGDIEQFQFYEPFFIEQEMLIRKRSTRQFTSTRTHTIFSSNPFNMNNNQYNSGV